MPQLSNNLLWYTASTVGVPGGNAYHRLHIWKFAWCILCVCLSCTHHRSGTSLGGWRQLGRRGSQGACLRDGLPEGVGHLWGWCPCGGGVPVGVVCLWGCAGSSDQPFVRQDGHHLRRPLYMLLRKRQHRSAGNLLSLEPIGKRLHAARGPWSRPVSTLLLRMTGLPLCAGLLMLSACSCVKFFRKAKWTGGFLALDRSRRERISQRTAPPLWLESRTWK